jgi:hypothetical protein
MPLLHRCQGDGKRLSDVRSCMPVLRSAADSKAWASSIDAKPHHAEKASSVGRLDGVWAQGSGIAGAGGRASGIPASDRKAG